MKRTITRIAAITFVMANLAMASIFVFHEFLGFTSSNSAVYLLRGKHGGFEIKRDARIEEADRVVFKVDANGVFNYLVKGLAVAKHRSVLELTWDEEMGVGQVKQFRADGTALSYPFSRFSAGALTPRGLFLGGDPPLGDKSRSRLHDTSGMGYFDGSRWYHIWCQTDEGIKIQGGPLEPLYVMDFTGSRVLKQTDGEIILESSHQLVRDGNVISMKRLAFFRAGDDFYILKVVFTNEGENPLIYSYSWADEPWVGDFGSARGDVGWYGGGLVETEKIIPPNRYRYAGFWDHGNGLAGEGADFTGKANFVEWAPPLPSYVLFSNSAETCCDESVPLSSDSFRILDIVWPDQTLMPGESRTYTLAIGMASADPATGMPVKPSTGIN